MYPLPPPASSYPASTAIPSSRVDLPVPFSPTMMVMGRSKPNSKLSPRNGRQNGYAARSTMRDGSSQRRRRYGAGRLMVRFRLAAMRDVRGNNLYFNAYTLAAAQS